MKNLMIAIMLFLSFFGQAENEQAQTAPFLIVNKQSNELAYINDGEVVRVFRIATGATNKLTPNGLHKIIIKAVKPYYRKKNIPGGSPDNPLGSRWIGFDAKGTDGRIYGVHGTNKPDSIGKNVSAGCIRMKNEEVEQLFTQIAIGTKIFITESDEDFETIVEQVNKM
ncbi:L,D-transpeptidase [Aquibacillus saliphilus]|uniref:L,D-transpeptidase n=1 Tax=Aquibacillus saliphilus TaxID=1909422 RepID=UPI001CF07077|nr:L,D-transpeptidase [Aquibacillus saliphilus]